MATLAPIDVAGDARVAHQTARVADGRTYRQSPLLNS